MENLSIIVSFELTMDPFSIPPGAKYPIFIFGIIMYMFGAFCNLTLMLLILLTESLHKPMYIIMFNLPLNDFVGISAMLPKVLSDILTETSKTYYPLCVFQGFLLHMYGGGVLFVLAAMAFDRYVAICMPLRYNSIMTPMVVKGTVAIVWGIDLFFIILLFSMQSKYSRCRSKIMNVFCDNPSLLKLTCDNIMASNIVGLFNTAMIQILSISIQLFSYIKILVACLVSSKSEGKSKAINTCIAQLVILILFEIVSTFTILSHRFSNVNPDLQKIMGMLIFLVPPILNPIVYGLNSHELRTNLLKITHRKVSKM